MIAKVPKHFVLDNILSREELLWIYHRLIATPKWELTRVSNPREVALRPFMGFPGLVIQSEDQVYDDFLSGYFTGLIFRIRHLIKKDHNLVLPRRVVRIHIGAKSSYSKTETHADSERTDYWTILGFLNPVWNSGDGGEFYLEEHRIEYKSGRFVIFPSGLLHDGGFVRNEKLSYWRVAVNIILGVDDIHGLTGRGGAGGM